MLQTLLRILGAITLAITLLAMGFGAACLPFTTSLLSNQTSNVAVSPYNKEQLVMLAEQTRSFTVDNHQEPAASVAARTSLFNAIMDAASAASTNPETNSSWSIRAQELVLSYESGALDAETAALRLSGLSTSYALDTNAVSHLEDCNVLISNVTPLLWLCVILAAGILIYLWFVAGRAPTRTDSPGSLDAKKTCAHILVAAPLGLVTFLAVCALWALVDFNDFFTLFHGIFFPQGNWTFAYDSLLICMYPTAFWMAMGAVWLGVSAVASILSLIGGITILRRLKTQTN